MGLSEILKNCNAHQIIWIQVIDVHGSAPCMIGSQMVFNGERALGSIGGGNLEYQAIDIARQMWLTGKPNDRQIKEFSLSVSLGQCCGGHLRLAFEVIEKPFTKLHQLSLQKNAEDVLSLVLFGFGHVTQALLPIIAPLLEDYQIQVQIYDDRDISVAQQMTQQSAQQGKTLILNDDIQHFAKLHIEQNVAQRIELTQINFAKIPVEGINGLKSNSLVLIMTYCHDLDYRICYQLLQIENLQKIGLIGSMTKAKRFKHRLGKAGFTENRLASLHCPIGQIYAHMKSPTAVAIAIAHQLLSWIDEQLLSKFNANT